MTGVVVWLVGLPSSGKSTLARAIAARSPAPTVVLDGDEIRDAIRPRHGYDEASRDAFYETLARLAALVARQGALVIVPATAHRALFRERARALAPAFVEVLLDTPREECATRDSKGLYAAADDASTLPGTGVPFERPEHPEIVVRPGDPDPVDAILTLAAKARAGD